MRILFVWPNKDQFGFKPISLALLSAILKEKGHDVDLFDTTFIDFGFKDNTEVRSKIRIFKKVDFSGFEVDKKKVDLRKELVKKLENFHPDIVCLSVLSDEIYIGFNITKIVKEWNDKVIVIWGNKAATMAVEKVLQCKEIDFICVGEGVEFLPEFIEYLSKGFDPRVIKNIAYRENDGKIVRNALRPFYQDLDSLPFFDWSIFDRRQFLKPFDGKIYKGGDHMIFWGCPNHCTYCINDSYRKLYGKGAGRFLRRYNVDRIINELKYLVDKWGINFLKFHDEDFCLKPINYFHELAEKYHHEIKIPFTIMANARNVTFEKVNFLKKMNCVSVTLGIETGNDKLRKEVLKRVETQEEIVNAAKIINDAGIRTTSFNMLAIPFEDKNTIMETIELNRKTQVRYPNAGFFFPLEGTQLRQTAIRNGFFNDDTNAVFQNDTPTLTFSNISTDELIKLRERFALYVKLPPLFYKYIDMSLQNDNVGWLLTEELYKIYDECVFSNDGFWNEDSDSQQYLNRLDELARGIYERERNQNR